MLLQSYLLRAAPALLLLLPALSFQNSFNVLGKQQQSKQKHQRKNVNIPPRREPEPSTQTLRFADAAISEGSQEPWTTPRLHNTAAIRSLAILGALGATSLVSSSPIPAQAMVTLHLFSFAAWFGTNAYTTFVLGITMFKNLPRKTFGKLQAKLFPKYFGLSSIVLVLQLVTIKFVKAIAVNKSKAAWALGIALGANALNQFLLEPMSTDNMMKRYDLEATPNGANSDEYKALKKSFGKFHGLSSLANLVSLCAGAVHGYLLAGSLA